jgi:hypothetical protein
MHNIRTVQILVPPLATKCMPKVGGSPILDNQASESLDRYNCCKIQVEL